MVNIAINGYGRIGQTVLRALTELPQYADINLVAINAPGDINTHLHLTKYDSVHGRFKGDIKLEGDNFVVNGKKIKILNDRDPANLPWGDLGADIVFECTGKFKKHADASRHLASGAKKILISAPAPDPDRTIVYGVNNEDLQRSDKIISVGSCTTNCLAPLAKVLDANFGIERAYMTTIHAYTRNQEILDGKNKDLRRARAAALSMIPTTTGAAKAISLVLPQLEGKIDGTAIRVPTPNVSLVDLTFVPKQATTAEAVNNAVKAASEGELNGVLEYVDEPLVSIDFNHDPHSSNFDSLSTKEIDDGKLIRVASWYDNEFGFSCRMLDIARLMS